MKLKIFTIYDTKAEAYLQPFFMGTKGQAIRAFQTSIEDPKTNFAKYPADFYLYLVGEYEDTTGDFENFKINENLGSALELNPNKDNLHEISDETQLRPDTSGEHTQISV